MPRRLRFETAEGPKTLSYDQLVLATGSRSHTDDVPWKSVGSYDQTIEVLHATSEKIKAASHIVVAGGGATGIELAGELGFEFGKTKEIVLLSAGPTLLNGDSIAGNAASELKKLNVSIKYDAYVESTKKLESGKIELVLKGGETITTDLYLPTHGLLPNSEYLDAKYLDANKNVVIDEFYRLKGAEDVWAAGDIVGKPRAGFMITQKQVGALLPVTTSFSSLTERGHCYTNN